MTATATREWKLTHGKSPHSVRRLFDVTRTAGHVAISTEFRLKLPAKGVRHVFDDVEVVLDEDAIKVREDEAKEKLLADPAVGPWIKLASEAATLESRKRELNEKLAKLTADQEYAVRESAEMLPTILADRQALAAQVQHINDSLDLLRAPLAEAKKAAMGVAQRLEHELRSALVGAFRAHEEVLLAQLEEYMTKTDLLDKLAVNAQRRNELTTRALSSVSRHERLLESLVTT